ncbi:hypothetical protein VCHENC02_0889A, partial [Vibrio harveyi]
MSGFVTTANF